MFYVPVQKVFKKQAEPFIRFRPFVLPSLNHCIHVQYNVIILKKTNTINDTYGYSKSTLPTTMY